MFWRISVCDVELVPCFVPGCVLQRSRALLPQRLQVQCGRGHLWQTRWPQCGLAAEDPSPAGGARPDCFPSNSEHVRRPDQLSQRHDLLLHGKGTQMGLLPSAEREFNPSLLKWLILFKWESVSYPCCPSGCLLQRWKPLLPQRTHLWAPPLLLLQRFPCYTVVRQSERCNGAGRRDRR